MVTFLKNSNLKFIVKNPEKTLIVNELLRVVTNS